MDVSEEEAAVLTITIAVKRANKTKVDVEAQVANGMAVYMDPDKPDRLGIATQTGKPLLKLLLTRTQMLRAMLLLGEVLPEAVKRGEKSMTAWKTEDRESWKYYDRFVRHITMSVQLGDWR